jgi:hypothetical protein
VHGHGQRGEHLAAGGPGRGGADEHTPLGVGDQLDDALVAGLVDPPPGRGRYLRQPDGDVQACLTGLRLGQPDRADLRVVRSLLAGSELYYTTKCR